MSFTIRTAGPTDLPALARLAALDSAEAPSGPVLVGESRGRMLAALPLLGGRAIADPFEPTAPLIDLLRARGRQLRAA